MLALMEKIKEIQERGVYVGDGMEFAARIERVGLPMPHVGFGTKRMLSIEWCNVDGRELYIMFRPGCNDIMLQVDEKNNIENEVVGVSLSELVEKARWLASA